MEHGRQSQSALSNFQDDRRNLSPSSRARELPLGTDRTHRPTRPTDATPSGSFERRDDPSHTEVPMYVRPFSRGVKKQGSLNLRDPGVSHFFGFSMRSLGCNTSESISSPRLPHHVFF